MLGSALCVQVATTLTTSSWSGWPRSTCRAWNGARRSFGPTCARSPRPPRYVAPCTLGDGMTCAGMRVQNVAWIGMDNSSFASHLLGLSCSAAPRWLRAWSLFSIKESDHRKQRCPAQCVCLCLLGCMPCALHGTEQASGWSGVACRSSCGRRAAAYLALLKALKWQ